MFESVAGDAASKERAIQERLFSLIDQGKSFIFDAGAGSGKTYSLVECLKHVVTLKGDALSKESQIIACITFTNVAVDEIRSRLGNSKVTHISTIHEFIWPFLSSFQDELVVIHRQKLEEKIVEKEEKVKEYENSILCDDEEVKSTLLVNKDRIYQLIDTVTKASELKHKLGEISDELKSIKITNASKFNDAVRAFYSIKDYRECIENIEDKKKGFKQVEYNPRINFDRLTKMQISHDTVLEYSKKMFDQHPELSRLFVDRYPYLFIDEYQDTSSSVVDVVNNLVSYSNEKDLFFVAGFLGDSAQKIYSSGCGDIEEGLYESVQKPFNRRSCEEIIHVSNQIRNDGLVQRTIYVDASGGSVRFFHCDIDISENEALAFFLKQEKRSEKDYHFFELTNRTVCKSEGFGDLYELLNRSPYYKRNYQQLNPEFLTNNTMDMGAAVRILFSMSNLVKNLTNSDSSLKDVGFLQILTKVGYVQVSKAIDVLCSKNPNNLGDFIDFLEASLQNNDENWQSEYSDWLIKEVGFEAVSKDALIEVLIRNLTPNRNLIDENDDSYEKAVETVQSLLNLNMDVYYAWLKYIDGLNDSSNKHHTFHGVKGAEFDRVIAIGGNKYTGNRKTNFDLFFENWSSDGSKMDLLTDKEKAKYIEARNLLYVAATRAKKEFIFIYRGHIDSFRGNIESIFGEVKELSGD